MNRNQLTATEERELIQRFFAETRQNLKPYFEERRWVLSNSQLFSFILVSPITIAIASDGNLDFSETTMLVDIASYFDRDILPHELDKLPQPPNAISNQEFKRSIFSELRYLCLSMSRYEKPLIKSIRDLIRLDEQVSREQDPSLSIKRRVADMMHSVIYNNLGSDVVEEKKVRSVLRELGIH